MVGISRIDQHRKTTSNHILELALEAFPRERFEKHPNPYLAVAAPERTLSILQLFSSVVT